MTLRRTRLSQHRSLTDRRPGSHPGRRFALALGLALALLGWAGAASADSGASPMVTATIYASDGATSTVSVSSSQLLADPQDCPAYSSSEMEEQSSSGTNPVGLPDEHGAGTGTWTLPTILGCMTPKVAVSDVTGITVISGSGTPETGQDSQLTSADLASPQSDFANGAEYPVVSNLGSSFQYNRPQRRPGDLNANDQVTTSDAIAIEVFEGPPLTVSATASASTVPAGTSVSFAAQVSGDQGSALTYHWSFGDNLPDSPSDSPSVSYADPGDYKVTLQVTDANGGGGATTVPITVTGSSSTPSPSGGSSSPAPTGAAGTGTNPNGGAHGSQGGNGKGRGAHPSKGNGNRSGSPSTTPAPSSSHQQKRSGAGSSPSSGGSTSTPADSSPSTSPTPTTPASSTPSPPASSTATPPSSPRRPAAPTRRRTRGRGSGSAGPLVTGRLIADVTPLPAGVSPLVRQSPGSAAAAPRPPTPPRRSALPVIAGCLAIVLLLGLGARRELAGPGWWRTLRPSS